MSQSNNLPLPFRLLLALSRQTRHIWDTQCHLVTKLLAEVDQRDQVASVATDWVIKLDEENKRLRAEVDELRAKNEEYRGLCKSLVERLSSEQPIGPGFILPLHAN